MSLQNDCVTAIEAIFRSSVHRRVPRRWSGYTAFLLVTLAISTLAPAIALAQDGSGSHQSGYRVAVVDVGHIFKSLPEIKALVSKTRRDLKQREADRQQQRDALKHAVAHLKTLKAGTSEFASQEEHVAKLDSKLRNRIGHRHHRWSDVETEIFLEGYQRINAAVKQIATQQNISLVVRLDGEHLDAADPESVIRGVMGNVVYHDESINITDAVIRYLERQTNMPPAASNGGTKAIGADYATDAENP